MMKFSSLKKRALGTVATCYGYYKARPWLRWTISVLIVFIPFFLLCYSNIDPDFGWHLQTGNYIRAHGIPAHDIYTYTASSFRWIDHEWGSDVLLSFAYGTGGYLLSALIAATLWTASLALSMGKKMNPLLALLGVLALSPYVFVRPTVFTVLFFALLIALFRRKETRLYWFIPLLFIAWANLHGGFIAGLALIAYFAVMRRSKQLAVVFALSVVATLCNGYGIRIYEEVARTIFDSRLHSQVQEWHSFDIQAATMPLIIAWAAGFWICEKDKWKRFLRLPFLLLLASLSATRNAALFAVAALPDTAAYWRELLPLMPRRPDRNSRLIAGVLSVILLTGLGAAAVAAYHDIGIYAETKKYPVTEVAYLREHPCPGRIFNTYNYGGYLIWKLPGTPVYIDGRMPTWQQYMDRYEAVSNHPAANYKAEFAKYGVDCALLDRKLDKKFVRVLQQDGWETISKGNGAILLVTPGHLSR